MKPSYKILEKKNLFLYKLKGNLFTEISEDLGHAYEPC